MPDSLYSLNQRTFLSPWLEDVSCAQMESLGMQGGFSGAVIWKVSIQNKNLCLRCWPQGHPTIDGLSAIHGLLQHVEKSGFALAPVPLPTLAGQTFFLNEEHLWELAPWMPGEASFLGQPSRTKLEAAVSCLAEFHRAAERYTYAGNERREAPSPGLQQRLALLQDLQRSELDKLWKAVRSASSSRLQELTFELLEGISRPLDRVIDRLQQIVNQPLPLQWCLRDVRHDHILYTADRVTGLIDFGAVAVDSVAGDIARLLGSMVNDDADSWRVGIEAYSRIQTLSENQRRAIVGFDQGGTLCSAANWARWLFVDHRSFAQTNMLKEQLSWLATRLGALE
ncbi:MAG: phosphotransferase [Planctomycetes bacterium]|nr:phosphotransferase [Planctomycetota bacterium]